jgi:hypothetical protein
MFKGQRKAGFVVLMLAAGSVLAFASPASAVSASNACRNSVTSNASQLGTDTSGTSPASVVPGGSVPLSGIQQQLSIPGAIFVAGYNLGVLTVGQNTIPINVRSTIEATNTVQGQQNTSTVGGTPPDGSLSVTTTITDPDTTPGTGDETATDATGSVSYPNLTWTAAPSGPIEFRQQSIAAPPPTADNTTELINALIGGAIGVQFRCAPGTVTGPDPGVITLMDPAPTFASTQVQANPQCKKLKKQLKKAKKAHDKAKVKKIRKKMSKLGC